ncbi:MAG: hypothetical protein GX335_10260 [Firmicutes bacterium]|nr:hypothetical protein [Bacillota bacterium]
MELNELRADLALRTKRGIPFVWASLFLWAGVMAVWCLPLPGLLFRNSATIFCALAQVPAAALISQAMKLEFHLKDNPLQGAAILCALNQLLYFPIAAALSSIVPGGVVLILALISGAHLLPFSWLYHSRSYLIMSLLIPLTIFLIGFGLPQNKIYLLAATMVVLKSVLVTWLSIEITAGSEKAGRTNSLNRS